MNICVVVIILLFFSNNLYSEETSTKRYASSLFLDSYIAHDFANLGGADRDYTTQAVSEDQLELNLALIDFNFEGDSNHFRLALQHGSSVKANYAAEDQISFRYLNEAYWGYEISEKLWFDVGVYNSHLGFESFVSRDNWTYTRSLVAEFSPYYETGAKLTYDLNKQDNFQFHILRGWQNISAPEEPALGFKYSHIFNQKLKFSYANFIGDANGQRFFNDFIISYDFSHKFKIAIQLDVGRQEVSADQVNDSKDELWWHGTTLMSQYRFNEKLALSLRVESFYDPDQAVVTPLNSAKFNVLGLSVNLDYQIHPKLFWRNEYRLFSGEESVYQNQDGFSKSSKFIVTALVYSFDLY